MLAQATLAMLAVALVATSAWWLMRDSGGPAAPVTVDGSMMPSATSAGATAEDTPRDDRVVGTTLGPEVRGPTGFETAAAGTAGARPQGTVVRTEPRVRGAPPGMVAPTLTPTPSTPSGTPSTITPPPSLPSRPLREEPARAPSRSAGIQVALMAYRDAVGALNAAAVRAIWPSADAIELARAFDRLHEQRLDLENCRIASEGSTAVATCAGTLLSVPKDGAQAEQERRQWEFSLREENGSWLIDRVETR